MNWSSIGKGFRTIAIGAAIAVAPAALTYIGGIDWTSFGISPSMGAAIGVAVMALRSITNTPVAKAV